MNPLVIFILTLGALIGYGFARLQLRGRFVLAQEAIEDAEAERRVYEWKQTEASRILNAAQIEADRLIVEAQRMLDDALIRTRRCPDGYSAKQIIGHDYFGTVHPPQFEGGLPRWKELH